MEITIRIVKDSELGFAFDLIWEVFQKYVAPDYTEEGIKTFYEEFISSKRFRERFYENKEVMYGAYVAGKLAGVISVSQNHTVSCLFVDGAYHHMGIGKQLFSHVVQELQNRGVQQITLNASPYALPFYSKLGFEPTGDTFSYQGIIATPMKKHIKENEHETKHI